ISAIKALARLDWDAAKPMVQTIANGANPYRAAQALGITYEQANRSGDTSQADALRAQLQAMVTNRQTPVSIRQSAFQALMTTEWNGQEDWYISLFNDTSLSGAQLEEKPTNKADEKTTSPRNKGELGRLTEDGVGFNFLWLPMQENATRWLPVVTRLVGNSDRAVHLAAVSCLAEIMAVDVSAKDQLQQAARVLLPWLTDPKWGGDLERWSYIGSLSKMDLPEAVPGLIWILDNDEEAESRAMAAEALIRYKNPQAIQPLRRAMNRENDEQLREIFISAIIQLDGFSDDEATTAIEAFARKVDTPEGQKEIAEASDGDSKKPLLLPVSIGRVYDRNEEVEITESLAVKLFERAKSLRPTLPEVARQIMAIAENADLMIADLNLVERIGEGWIDVNALKMALEGRVMMRKHVSDELASLFKQGGYAAGVAAILLDNESNHLDILKGKDQNAQLALLAAARFTRERLPVESVGKLLAIPSLTAVGENYLQVEGSAEARKIVWARHPGEARILGESLGADTAGVKNGAYALFPVGKWEESLRTEVRAEVGASTSEEIYAMVPSFNPGLFGSIIIRARIIAGKRQTEISLQNEEGRRRVRLLTDNEWQDFKQFVTHEEIENLGPQNRKPEDEFQPELIRFEYLRLTKDGGRRIMTCAPAREPKKNATPREQLAGLFYQLSHTGEFKLRYAMEDKIPGLEVLLADDKRRVFNACQEGSQLRLMVEPERAESLSPGSANRPPFSVEWRTLTNGQLGAAVEEPRSCRFYNMMLNAPEWVTEVRQRFGVMMDWRARLGDAWIAPAVIEGESGIWKFEENKSPVKIAEGTYVNVVVTPDGKWIVAKKILQSADKYEMQITRIGINTEQRGQTGKQSGTQTGREFAVGAAQLSAHYPITFIPAHNKVFLGQGHYQYGREFNGGIYYLLDAETGALQQVKGEFRPLQDQFTRSLQATEKPNEFWAAIYDLQKKVTTIGRYDARAFAFSPVMEVPEIRVSSADVWVDAAAGKVYLTYLGHLLRMPLAK
ncbi:MAG: HEAT repeat domain-containing protein, partial [Blastocatellia bacterium]